MELRYTVEWTPKADMVDFDFDDEFWTSYVPYAEKSFSTKKAAEKFAVAITATDFWHVAKIHCEEDMGFDDSGHHVAQWETFETADVEGDKISDYWR